VRQASWLQREEGLNEEALTRERFSEGITSEKERFNRRLSLGIRTVREARVRQASWKGREERLREEALTRERILGIGA
jgi:hypothetical protein